MSDTSERNTAKDREKSLYSFDEERNGYRREGKVGVTREDGTGAVYSSTEEGTNYFDFKFKEIDELFSLIDNTPGDRHADEIVIFRRTIKFPEQGKYMPFTEIEGKLGSYRLARFDDNGVYIGGKSWGTVTYKTSIFEQSFSAGWSIGLEAENGKIILSYPAGSTVINHNEITTIATYAYAELKKELKDTYEETKESLETLNEPEGFNWLLNYLRYQ